MDHDGIGQTTRAARYRVLHTAVGEAISAALAKYDVKLVTLPSTGDTRLHRLIPADHRCAPITVEFDDFPGVAVRFGRWYTENIPSCGCDYCDDDAGQLAHDLRDRIEAVASVGFSEEPSGDRVIGVFRALGGDSRRSKRRSSDSSRRGESPPGAGLPEPPNGAWLPWPVRPA